MLETVEARKQLLHNELMRLVALLSARTDVEGIIVYGSYVNGTMHGDSDLDLCVIQETDLLFSDRARALNEWLEPRVPVDLVVYTPKEFMRLKRRWPFTRDQVLGKGQILFARNDRLFAPPEPLTPEEKQQLMIENYQDWIKQAREDLAMAQLAQQAQIWNQVCFHAQQCVEKCLKALIVRQSHIVPPRSHAIKDLMAELPEAWFSDLRESLMAMDRFYISTRYPTAEPGELPAHPIGQGAADMALDTARVTLARTERIAQNLQSRE